MWQTSLSHSHLDEYPSYFQQSPSSYFLDSSFVSPVLTQPFGVATTPSANVFQLVEEPSRAVSANLVGQSQSPRPSYRVEIPPSTRVDVTAPVSIPSCQPVRTPKPVCQDPPKPAYLANTSTQTLCSYQVLNSAQVSAPPSSWTCPRTPEDSHPNPQQYLSQQQLPPNSFQHNIYPPASTFSQYIPSHLPHPAYPSSSSFLQYTNAYQHNAYPNASSFQQYNPESYQYNASYPSNTYPQYVANSGYQSSLPHSNSLYPAHTQYAPNGGYTEIPANQSPEASVIRTNTPPSYDYPTQYFEGDLSFNTQVVQEPNPPFSTVPPQPTQDIELPDYPCATSPSTKSPCNIKDKKSFVICVVYCARRIEGLGVTWDDTQGCLHVARENPNITPFLLACRSAFGVRERINKNYYSEFFDESKECFRRMSGNKKVPKKKPVDVLPNLAEGEKVQFRQYCGAFVEKLRAASYLFREVEGLKDPQKFDAFFNGLVNLHEDIC